MGTLGRLRDGGGLYDPRFEHDACGLGAVVRLDGGRTHELLGQALTVLETLEHRGATGADPDTGDGAGIMTQIPHELLRQAYRRDHELELPSVGDYAVGVVFLPQDPGLRLRCEEIFVRIVAEEGHRSMGWRDVPVCPDRIGRMARESEPVVRKIFVQRRGGDDDAFSRKLAVIRRRVEKTVGHEGVASSEFSICSLSQRTIVLKGLLKASQLRQYYPDLTDPSFVTGLALVHSRFSTNTLGSWDLAHPFNFVAHNGEINTIRANENWLAAREPQLRSELFGGDLQKLFPIVEERWSDTAKLDAMVELLVLGGRSLEHGLAMLMPPAWTDATSELPDEIRAFHEFHSALVEPWDGPAAIVASNGDRVVAALDRNGLRPIRYVRTSDGLVVLASEAGVLPLEPERLVEAGRLQPGRMIVLDPQAGRLIHDDEVKRVLARRKPYGRWLGEQKVFLDHRPSQTVPALYEAEIRRLQQTFGYTTEELRLVMVPMARDGKEPVGSMGDDTPLAALSERPKLITQYFKQHFAQVTNPPIDPQREQMVMSLQTSVGPIGNLLGEQAGDCRRVAIATPVLQNEEMAKLRHLENEGFESATLSTLYEVAEGLDGLTKAVDTLCRRASQLVWDGTGILILSDRGVDVAHAPIPPLLAAAAVHSHLVREGARTLCGLVVESGEPRETMHVALLLGYGAAAINPYLALDTVNVLQAQGELGDVTATEATKRYVAALSEGILKVCSRMGISTVQSYRGAQIFEAIGLGPRIVDRYFPGTASRVGGLELADLQGVVAERHARAFGLQVPSYDYQRSMFNVQLATVNEPSSEFRVQSSELFNVQRSTFNEDDVGAALVAAQGGPPSDADHDATRNLQGSTINEDGVGAALVAAQGGPHSVPDHSATQSRPTNSRLPTPGLRTPNTEHRTPSVEQRTPNAEHRSPNAHLDPGGEYQLRRRGEHHAWNADTIVDLQRAVRTKDEDLFRRFSDGVEGPDSRLTSLRSLFKLNRAEKPIPMKEVEGSASIVRRFATGAMSLGSLSPEAHETLAIGVNRIGARSNTGEGGEDPARSIPDENGDSRRSAIKQVASGRFGVTTAYLVDADQLQIKIAQGAKPGEGGQIPGHKVDERIARLRHATPGVALISPPPHHDIYSIEDLAQLIHDLKCVNPSAEISVKLVSEAGVGTVAAGVAKARADHIVIAGHDGGTGASPMSSLKYVGLPWEIGLAETHQVLVRNGLRSRVRLQVDGGLRTGRDVIVAALLGADEFAFGTAPLVAMGCVMMRVCHLNTCPVGIATQDPELRRRFTGTPEDVIHYLVLVAEQVRKLMSKLGVPEFDHLVGRTDLLALADIERWPWLRDLDLSPLLWRERAPGSASLPVTRNPEPETQNHHLEKKLVEHDIIAAARPAIEGEHPVTISRRVETTDRTLGAMLAGEIARQAGPTGLPDGSITLRLTGTGGQSFGAFAVHGMTLDLVGVTNDYVAKGLSGGRIIVHPPAVVRYVAEENIVAGNVALYGATAGEAFFRGRAGERFCVRNSGATAVVEGVGDHGCEYMTGGVALILGPTGRNFGAGMSGGVAYVLNHDGRFENRCNHEMISVEPLSPADTGLVQALLLRHAELTGSAVARRLLGEWPSVAGKFKAVVPNDVRHVRASIEPTQIAAEPSHLPSSDFQAPSLD